MRSYKVKLDKQRTLKLPNASLEKLEDLLDGRTVFDFMEGSTPQQIGSNFLVKLLSVTMLKKVVWAGLLWIEDEEFPMEWVVDHLPQDKVELATDCMNMLMDAYGLKIDVSEIEADKKKVNGIGTKPNKPQSVI